MYQNDQQRDFARNLRKKATDAERLLWSHLRKRQLQGCRFRRQVGIGEYIVDFECFEHHLVIELDGGQHNTNEAREQDAIRTSFLQSQEYRVIRFWNHEVMDDLDAVLEVIAGQLGKPLSGGPHPGPPPGGEGDTRGEREK